MGRRWRLFDIANWRNCELDWPILPSSQFLPNETIVPLVSVESATCQPNVGEGEEKRAESDRDDCHQREERITDQAGSLSGAAGIAPDAGAWAW